MLPIVAIVGRPNVGKSTLFNRLVGRHVAIVEDEPGVTRDRHYAEVEWGGRHFMAVDTGGFWVDTEEPLLKDVRKQAALAIAQSHAVILVVDARAGATPADQELAREARKSGKPILVALNKLDTQKTEDEAGRADFYRLGLQDFYAVSAEHGRGFGPLLDDLVKRLPEDEPPPIDEADERPRVAILGRPNVGKSTFANRLLGEQRFVESPIAGTTRDALDAEVTSRGRRYVLTDTAGIRRKGQTAEKLEFASVARAFDALERSHVAIVLFDAAEPAVEQDSRLVGLCAEKVKPMILVINKADLVKGKAARKAVTDAIEEHLPFLLSGTPVVFVSARHGTGMDEILPLAGKLYDQAGQRVGTPEINRFLREAEEAHPAPRAGRWPVRLYYMTQVAVRPPTFLIHVNRPDGITESYKRFLVARMREHWDLKVPVRLVFRKRRR